MRPIFPVLKVLLSCSCLIALFAIKPQAAIAGSAVPKVLVTVAPLKPVADALLAGITHSTVLARPGQDAHHMTLSPSQTKALADAEIIIVPDRKLSSVINQFVEKAEQRGTIVIALTELQGAEPLPYETEQPWLGSTSKASKQTKGLTDPHLWLDPLRMAAIATPLAEGIAQHTPSLRAQLLGNARAWQRHLVMELDPELRKLLGSVEMKKRYNSRPFIPFITNHSAYQYFFARYGIENHGALTLLPEDLVGARSQHTALKRAGEVTIGCLVTEQETPMVKRVATASGARIVKFNPELLPARSSVPALHYLQDDYDRLIYKAAMAFVPCL